MRTVASMTLQHIQFAGAEGQRLAIRIGMYQQSAELVILFIRHQHSGQSPGEVSPASVVTRRLLRIARTRSMSHSRVGPPSKISM